MISVSINNLTASVDALGSPGTLAHNPITAGLSALFVPTDPAGDLAPATIVLKSKVPAMALLPGLADIPAPACVPYVWDIPGFFGQNGWRYVLNACDMPGRLFGRALCTVAFCVIFVFGLVSLARRAFTEAR